MPGLAEATNPEFVTLVLYNTSGQKKEFVIRPLNMKVGGLIQSWINKQPRPTNMKEAAELCKDLSPLVQREMIENARRTDEEWPPQIMWQGGGGLGALMAREGGLNAFVTAVLGQARPELDQSELKEYAESVTIGDVTRIIATTFNVGFAHEITARNNQVILMDRNGLSKALMAAGAMAGGADVSADTLKLNAQILCDQAHRYGTVIRMIVSDDEIEAPKVEAQENGLGL